LISDPILPRKLSNKDLFSLIYTCSHRNLSEAQWQPILAEFIGRVTENAIHPQKLVRTLLSLTIAKVGTDWSFWAPVLGLLQG
jgi:hypothetical protein